MAIANVRLSLPADAVVAGDAARMAAITKVRERQPAVLENVELSADGTALVVCRTNLTKARFRPAEVVTRAAFASSMNRYYYHYRQTVGD